MQFMMLQTLAGGEEMIAVRMENDVIHNFHLLICIEGLI